MIGFVSGASYPAPFASDSVIVVGASDTITTTNIASNLDSTVTTIEGGQVFILDSDKSKEKIFSGEEICELTKGCWVEKKNLIEIIENNETINISNSGCFPYGYYREGYYCGTIYNKNLRRDENSLVKQKNAYENCSHDSQCKSNLCFNEECIDTLKTIDNNIIKINKSDIEELKNIIDNIEKTERKEYSKEISENLFNSLIELLKKMFNF